MRFLPLVLVFALLFAIKPVRAESSDLFHDRIDTIASRFLSLNIPGLEKIQLPQVQPDGSLIFIYVWHPRTHKPTTASFEANVGDYFDIMGSQSKAFTGWCYLKKSEMHIKEAETGSIAVMRIWALGFNRHAPRGKCHGGMPGAAGQLGQTQVIKDPRPGLLSMVRSGHPTRFPAVEEQVQ